MTEAEEAPPGVDTSTPSAARLYDYYLGGTNNFPVDQAAGDQLKAALPDLYDAAWANRGFHQRSAIWMAKERGIRQFIDIGSGLPTQGNTHQAVKKAIADPLVVYVDKDPMVRAMADGLLADERRTRLVVADMRDPGEVLGNPELRSLIDFSQPVGLLMTAVLHFVADGSDPWGLVKRYTDALAPDSYLALSHATGDGLPARSVQAMYETYQNAQDQLYLRTREEVLRFFDGLELVPPYGNANPDISYVGVWAAEDPEEADTEGSRILYCGVARRP
ncbi:MAG TPA: SAM-dependent methyltransferase [Streptosporangiaceae bacterium]|nr:SAM-dependent methyltransferase [Streptosporangiaceae bacterium]